jgi:hypothetical protein
VHDLWHVFGTIAVSIVVVIGSISSVSFKQRSGFAASFTTATLASDKGGTVSSIAHSIISIDFDDNPIADGVS